MTAYVSARTGKRAHLLLVSYLFSPTDLPPARRAKALRDAFGELGVRTTVVTSAVSPGPQSQEDGLVIRAPDLRAHIEGPHRLLDQPGLRVVSRPSRRRLTRLLIPDATALSWAPAALFNALRIVRSDPPDAVITSSPPESTHLVGLALRRLGVFWIADLRDGWTFEPPTSRPYLGPLDRALERHVVRRASCVTAATGPLVSHLARVGGPDARVIELANGFDPKTVERATDERGLLDPRRFSIVYTGTGKLDGKDPIPFLRALTRLLEERPPLRKKLEIVFAGNFLREEADAMLAPELAGMVHFVGRLEHRRALGLQRAADGLLLITSAGARSIATGKVYEYLAACKPILALAEGSAAAELLGRAGAHVTAPPDDESRIHEALRAYVDMWVENGRVYDHDRGFDPAEYATGEIARRLLDIFVELGALRGT